MIGYTAIKPVWIFPELDFFSKLKPFSTYLLTGFHMKNKFSPENVLIRKTVVILSILLKCIFCVFYRYLLLSLFSHYYCFSNFYHCFVTIIILQSLIYYLIIISLILNAYHRLQPITEWKGKEFLFEKETETFTLEAAAWSQYHSQLRIMKWIL